MAGYIGKSQGVTQVDGYNRTETDDRYVNVSGDTISGTLFVDGQVNDTDVLRVGYGLTELAVRVDSSDGELRLSAQDGSGNNYAKYMTFYTEGGSGPTEGMRIDSAGRVTMPYQPAFYASIDYDDGGYVTNYDYTWLNRGSHFNATTGLFTAPVAGVYVFAATIMAGADAAYTWWKFSINGASTGGIHHTHLNSSESYRTLSGNAVFQLSQNDTVGVYMGANTAYGGGPSPWSSFSGYLIG